MDGKVCLVTGATAGIGAVTAEELARKGAIVAIVGRNPKKCATAADYIRRQTGNPKVDYLLADLSSLNDIRRLAKEFKSRYPRLDVLVNNAGGLFLKREASVDGIELTFALNHLAYFLLTNLLLDVLKANAPSRVVSVSSAAHIGARLDFADLQISGWDAYKRSKLANLLFTYELARRLEGTRVTANALHPGLVASDFGTNNRGLFRLMKPVINIFAISNERGAQTSVYLASSPEVEGVTGQYFVRRKAVRSSEISYNRAAAARLWEVSAAITGLAPKQP
jgi:NAD(P)-dependent dehydrogenase (short-subunit alcohol dehydrogenase family)